VTLEVGRATYLFARKHMTTDGQLSTCTSVRASANMSPIAACDTLQHSKSPTASTQSEAAQHHVTSVLPCCIDAHTCIACALRLTLPRQPACVSQPTCTAVASVSVMSFAPKQFFAACRAVSESDTKNHDTCKHSAAYVVAVHLKFVWVDW
jgi:2-methylcitrate dehydratase PrpD